MGSDFPFILTELVLVFGGVLAFGWWQFRDLKREREKTAARKAAEANATANAAASSPRANPD